MKKIGIVFFLVSVLLLSACAAPGGAAAPAAATPTAGVVNTNYDNALPVPSQLALGTIMLKDTQNPVTTDQAAKLLPLWQAVQSMTSSTSTSAVEFNALVTQIQQTMQPAQLEAIANLKITQASMASAFQTLGLNNFHPAGMARRSPGRLGRIPAGALGVVDLLDLQVGEDLLRAGEEAQAALGEAVLAACPQGRSRLPFDPQRSQWQLNALSLAILSFIMRSLLS